MTSMRRLVTVAVIGVAVVGAGCAYQGASVDSSVPVCDTAQSTTSTVEIASSVFSETDRVLVHQPPCTNGPVDVIYLLHGAGADETQWVDIGALQAADRLFAAPGRAVVVVLPNVSAAYRCSNSCESKMSQFLLDEVEPRLVKAGLLIGNRVIGGISRGGGLALGAASAAPDGFVAAGGHSPAGVAPTTFEVLAGNETPVWLDVGLDDPLAGRVSDLAAILGSPKRQLSYKLNPGGHDRAYWRANAFEYLTWYRDQLRVAAG